MQKDAAGRAGEPAVRRPLPSSPSTVTHSRRGNLSWEHGPMSRARKDMNEGEQPDPDLAAQLRQSAGREWSEEAAEDERLTELLRRRRLELKDLMAELVNRGDRVSVEFGGHSFSGAVAAAGEDFARIMGPGQVADVRLDRARWSVIVSGDPTDEPAGAVESFMALLREFEAGNEIVRLALPGGDMVIGTIVVVAPDHVEMADVDDRRLYVPVEMILATIRSTDFH